MRNRIIAALVALFTIIGIGVMTTSAQAVAAPAPASAPSAFIAPQHEIFPTSDFWNPAQSTITVSDRTPNKDFRISQSAYAWGSLAADNMNMAYTTLQTCTGCIILYMVDKGDPLLGNPAGPMAANRTVTLTPANQPDYTSKCRIVIERQYWATHTDYRERQRAVTHEIGHCLGFMHSVYPWNACDQSIEANVYCVPGPYYTPSKVDYYELDYHYSR